MDNIIDFIVSHISWVAYLILIIFVGGLWYNVNQYNDFENTADQVISRSGGLTERAYNILQTESKDRYHNMFNVRLNDKEKFADKPVDYGDNVTYKIYIRIPAFNKTIKAGGDRTVQNQVRVDTN